MSIIISSQELPEINGTFLSPDSRLNPAWENLKNQKEITLVLTSGPSSAALALKVWPELANNIDSIIYAGGTFEEGDITPWAEKSVFADPYGMESLLNTGITITFSTLETAKKYGLSPKELAISYANNPTAYSTIACGVHTETTIQAKTFGCLTADYLSDHKFNKKNAVIIQ